MRYKKRRGFRSDHITVRAPLDRVYPNTNLRLTRSSILPFVRRSFQKECDLRQIDVRSHIHRYGIERKGAAMRIERGRELGNVEPVEYCRNEKRVSTSLSVDYRQWGRRTISERKLAESQQLRVH